MSENTVPLSGSPLLCPYCQSPIAAVASGSADLTCHECGGSFHLARAPLPSTVDEVSILGRFQLLECIGQTDVKPVNPAPQTDAKPQADPKPQR